MKKQNVLKKNWEFQKVINEKKQFVSNYLVVYYKKNNSINTRIGISISKKFASAVERNRYRRQTRAALDRINIFDKPYDVVLILRKPYLLASFEMKQKAIQKMLERL